MTGHASPRRTMLVALLLTGAPASAGAQAAIEAGMPEAIANFNF